MRIASDESGFSIVELLATAFILAVGIMGLTMLQLLAIRANTSSANMTRAVAVAERVLETVAMEGRRTLLRMAEGASPEISATAYLSADNTGLKRYVTASGLTFDSENRAKTCGETYFTVTLTRSGGTETIPVVIPAAEGGVVVYNSLFTVEVAYTDQVLNRSTGQTTVIPRVVRLARRVSHV